MALVSCMECGREVSDKATACIGCGAPVTANTGSLYSQALNNSRPPQIAQQTQVIKTAKSRGVFIILGLLFGYLGLHNFYAGYHGRGVAQLLITLFFGWLIIGLVITFLWAIIDLITQDTDAAGDRMV